MATTTEHPTTQHPEPSTVVYEMFIELAQATRQQVDICESTPDPAEARYKYDVASEFLDKLIEQSERIPDARERRTCQRQLETVLQQVKAIAYSIPYICQVCLKPWLPEDGPEHELCADCRNDGHGPQERP